MNILKQKLLKNYNDEILSNQDIQKVINSKAEDSLKSVTERLKEKLIIELDKYFPKIPEKEEINKNEAINNNSNNNNNNNNDLIDFNLNF